MLSNDGRKRFLVVSPKGKSMPVELENPGTLAVAISPEGTWIATSSHRTTGLRVWSLPDGKHRQTLRPKDTVMQTLATPDGRRLLLRASSGNHVFRTADWTELEPPPPGTRLDSMTASPDGRWLATIGDNEVHLLRADNFAPVARLIVPAHVGWLGESHPVFDRESRRLLVHTALGCLMRWDLKAMETELGKLGMGL